MELICRRFVILGLVMFMVFVFPACSGESAEDKSGKPRMPEGAVAKATTDSDAALSSNEKPQPATADDISKPPASEKSAAIPACKPVRPFVITLLEHSDHVMHFAIPVDIGGRELTGIMQELDFIKRLLPDGHRRPIHLIIQPNTHLDIVRFHLKTLAPLTHEIKIGFSTDTLHDVGLIHTRAPGRLWVESVQTVSLVGDEQSLILLAPFGIQQSFAEFKKQVEDKPFLIEPSTLYYLTTNFLRTPMDQVLELLAYLETWDVAGIALDGYHVQRPTDGNIGVTREVETQLPLGQTDPRIIAAALKAASENPETIKAIHTLIHEAVAYVNANDHEKLASLCPRVRASWLKPYNLKAFFGPDTESLKLVKYAPTLTSATHGSVLADVEITSTSGETKVRQFKWYIAQIDGRWVLQ